MLARDECGLALMRRVIFFFFLKRQSTSGTAASLGIPRPLTAVPIQPTRAELSRETEAGRGGGQEEKEDETSRAAVCQGPVTPTLSCPPPPAQLPPADKKRMKAFSYDCHS